MPFVTRSLIAVLFVVSLLILTFYLNSFSSPLVESKSPLTPTNLTFHCSGLSTPESDLPVWSDDRPLYVYLVLAKNKEEGEIWRKVAIPGSVDVVIMCWKDESCNESLNSQGLHWIHDSTLTWTSSRNHLLEVAQSLERNHSKQYLYYIFADGDAFLVPRPAKVQLWKTICNMSDLHSHSCSDELVGFRWFESILDSYRPPFASTDKKPINCQMYPNEEAVLVRYADADFNAFHREAVPWLLPYSAHFDAQTWYTSQAILLYRLLCIHGYAIQVNGFAKSPNETHAGYPRNGNPWELAQTEWHNYLPWEITSLLDLSPGAKDLQQHPCIFFRPVKRVDWQKRVVLGCKTLTMKDWAKSP